MSTPPQAKNPHLAAQPVIAGAEVPDMGNLTLEAQGSSVPTIEPVGDNDAIEDIASDETNEETDDAAPANIKVGSTSRVAKEVPDIWYKANREFLEKLFDNGYLPEVVLELTHLSFENVKKVFDRHKFKLRKIQQQQPPRT